MIIPRIVLSAPGRSSGKTTVTLGLTRALSQDGFQIQPFKKGPDYIDPMWLSAASGRVCRNLDHYLMGEDHIKSSFQRHSTGCDMAIIEGNMGLHDSMDLSGSGSTAHVAGLLKSPVILIVDCHGLNRGIAPLIMGYQQFEPDVPIKAVILNRVRGQRHENKLKAALEHYTGVEVIGAIPTDKRIEITERHLGLVPVEENLDLTPVLSVLERVIRDYVSVNRLMDLAKEAPPLDEIPQISIGEREADRVKIGIARDRAFHFYYPENLEALDRHGADLIPFDTLNDPQLPDVSGIYIGGGFPEVFMSRIEQNSGLLRQIKTAIDNGLPVYAECGGLMILSRSITWNGHTRQMVGAIPCDIIQSDTPKGFGYISLSPTDTKSWLSCTSPMRAHEFHYSQPVNLEGDSFIYRVNRGFGFDGVHDGLLYKNALVSYAHLHSVSSPDWAKSFVEFVKKIDYRLP